MTLDFKVDSEELKRELAKQISNFRKYRRENKNLATRFALTAAAVAAGAAICIGAASFFPSLASILNFCALVLTSSAAVLSAWNAATRPKELWELQSGFIAELFVIQERLVHMEKTGTLSDPNLRSCFDTYEKITREYNGGWQKLRAEE